MQQSLARIRHALVCTRAFCSATSQLQQHQHCPSSSGGTQLLVTFFQHRQFDAAASRYTHSNVLLAHSCYFTLTLGAIRGTHDLTAENVLLSGGYKGSAVDDVCIHMHHTSSSK